jgi:predicted dehydrogenase
MSPDRRLLNVGVIGASEWATTYHLPALKLLEQELSGGQTAKKQGAGPILAVRLHGIWNRTAARAQQAAGQFGIPTVYRDLDELASDERIDCFVVLVNPKVIPQIVARILPRGLPIFAEKSPGWSYREARELAETVKVANVVGFNRRYMPLNRRFREIVGGMSSPYFVECHFYRHQRLTDEFIIETGVHGINYLEFLCGPITAVQTRRRLNPSNGTYLWECGLQFASGLPGIAKFFPCSGSNIERFEVHCSDLSAYLHSPQTYCSDYPGRIVLHRSGKAAECIEGDLNAGILTNAGFVNEYLDFFAAAATGSETASNFANACSTMRAAEAIQRGENWRVERNLTSP